MTIRINGLFTYPIKACAGIAHNAVDLEARGLAWDRRWMVVDDRPDVRGRFLTQRELPRLALVQPTVTADALMVRLPGADVLHLPLQVEADMPTRSVVIWRDTADAHDEGAEVARALSDFLNAPVRLVRMSEAHYRRVDPKYSEKTAQVGFADAYPLLVTSEESLADLNVHLSARGVSPIPMSRFRPNVVVNGVTAWDEDRWAQFEIAGVAFEGVKLCARCAVTTVDQATGERPTVTEPTATLATFRKRERGVMFGQNVVHRAGGRLTVGDMIQVIDRYETEAP